MVRTRVDRTGVALGVVEVWSGMADAVFAPPESPLAAHLSTLDSIVLNGG